MSFSSIDTSLTLEALRSKPENQYFERKGRDTKPSRVANELIGMLNAGGGTLVVGLGDEGQLEDVSLLPVEDQHGLRKLVHEFIHPPANVKLEEITTTTGEVIFVYHVDQDYERLFQRKDNEAVFLRVADSNRGPLTRAEVNKLEYDRFIRSFEDEICAAFDPGHLDSVACQRYLKTMRYDGSFETLALKRNLARKPGDQVLYKNAAILLFAEDPSVYIPNASVRYVRYRGVDQQSGSSFNVVKDQRFEGPILSMIHEVETFIEASLRDHYFLNMDTGRFEKVSEFPKEAWLEGAINALCHRSYNLQGNCILIRHFDDRLEISNSGPLPAQVTVQNIKEERYSRNPRIARVLSEMGYVRELNEGVPRIFNSMRESMLAEPEYTDRNNTVTLTLRNKVSAHRESIPAATLSAIEEHWDSCSATQQQLIGHLVNSGGCPVEDLALILGLTKHAVRYNLRMLLERNLIERVSDKERDRSAIYRVKSD